MIAEQDDLSAGTEYPVPLSNSHSGIRERPDHHTVRYDVEGRIVEWECLRVTSCKRRFESIAGGPFTRTLKHRLGKITPDDVMAPPGVQARQKPRAGPDIEDLPWFFANNVPDNVFPRLAVFVLRDIVGVLGPPFGTPFVVPASARSTL
jgi:hypothetical protein